MTRRANKWLNTLRLIAAAPQMLEALDMVNRKGNKLPPDTRMAVWEAIASATGQSVLQVKGGAK